jgi:hypothetical protein
MLSHQQGCMSIDIQTGNGKFRNRSPPNSSTAGTDGDFLHASQARSTLFELVLNGLLQPRST